MRRTVRSSFVTVVAATAAVAGLLALPAANAATPGPPRLAGLGQLLDTDGCNQDVTGLAAAAKDSTCGAAVALKGAGSTAVTPDGAFVYVAGTTAGGSIDVFAREIVSGALIQVPGAAGCANVTGAGGCTAISELNGLASITITHAGSKLAVAIPGASKVLLLSIASNGALSRPSGSSGCVQNSPTPSQTCSPGSGVPAPTSVAFNGDDSSMYVGSAASGATTGSVAVFDLPAGQPVFRSCVQSGTPAAVCNRPDGMGANTTVGLNNVVALAVTGSTVYAASFGNSVTGAGGNVALISDDNSPSPTDLNVVACYGTAPTCTAARAVNGASDVVVPADGKNVYVSSLLRAGDGSIASGGVALFLRDTGDGTLTQGSGASGCIAEPQAAATAGTCTLGRGVKGVGALVASKDNKSVYTASPLNNPAGTNTANTGSGAVAVLDRNPASTPTAGILLQPSGSDGCVASDLAEGCALARGLVSPGNGAHSLVLTPTDSFLYVASAGSQSVAAFGRQASDLRITAAPEPGPYTVGQDYTITLSVLNAGQQDTTNVRISDLIGPGGAIVSAAPSQGSCTNPPALCNLGALAVDGTATVIVRWHATANGTQTNTARVGADQGDSFRDNNIAVTSLASGPVTLSVLSGSNQTAKVSTSFVDPIKVSLKDNTGAPLQGQTVTFTAPASSSPSAFFAGASSETVTTDAKGIATSSIPVANSLVGSYSVSITSPGAPAQSANLTNNTTGPSPSPTATASPTSGGRTNLSLFLTGAGTITPGTPSTWQGHGRAGDAVTLRCYSRTPANSTPGSGTPAYFDARTATLNNGGNATFSLNPGTNTRCFLKYTGLADSDVTSSMSIAQNVATALSLSAYRDGVRRYHFQGTNLPRRAGQLITLYRYATGPRLDQYCVPARESYLGSSGGSCTAIRTATAFTNSSNIWRIDRTFTGSGQFYFVARTSKTLTNVAGFSNQRLTIIH